MKPILAPLTECKSLAAGDPVVLTSPTLRVGIGPMMLGRVLDALGRPIDGRPLPKGLSQVDVDRSAPASLDRPPIDKPLATGVKAIDSLLTLGQGQRIGIFAGTGVGKSTLLGMLARGTAADAIVIAMVGERGREVRDFIERTLGEEGVRRSVLVVATSDQPLVCASKLPGLRQRLQNPSAILAKTYYCWLTLSPDLPWLSANYPLLRVSRRRRADTHQASSPPYLDSSNERDELKPVRSQPSIPCWSKAMIPTSRLPIRCAVYSTVTSF